VALFSVVLDEASSTNETQQKNGLIKFNPIRKWVTNRPESAIVAAGWVANIQKEKSPAKIAEKEQLLRNLVAGPLAANALQEDDGLARN
jgi:hypothetical protein